MIADVFYFRGVFFVSANCCIWFLRAHVFCGGKSVAWLHCEGPAKSIFRQICEDEVEKRRIFRSQMFEVHH